MRFLFYDRVDKLEKGNSIVGVKTFALSEEFYRRHFGKVALVPGTILVEAMAQLLGWLIIYSHDFKLSAIVSLVDGVKVLSQLRPGFEAELHGEIISTCATDSAGRAWMIAGGETIASIDRVLYSHFYRVKPAALRELFHYYGGRDFFPSKNPGE